MNASLVTFVKEFPEESSLYWGIRDFYLLRWNKGHNRKQEHGILCTCTLYSLYWCDVVVVVVVEV